MARAAVVVGFRNMYVVELLGWVLARAFIIAGSCCRTTADPFLAWSFFIAWYYMLTLLLSPTNMAPRFPTPPPQLPYRVVEVNPLTKGELQWSDYKKVPVIKMDEQEVVVDSTAIISRLAAEVEAAAAKGR